MWSNANCFFAWRWWTTKACSRCLRKACEHFQTSLSVMTHPSTLWWSFVLILLDHVRHLSAMSYTGITTEEVMYIGIIQNGLDRHWCWKLAGFRKEFWVLGWLLVIYKLLCRKKVFIYFEGGLIVKYSYSMQDFLLGMSLLLTTQDRKHTAALIRGSESLVYAKYWTLNCHSLLFSNPSSCLHEHTSQCSINRSLPFKADKPCWKVNLQTSFLLSFLLCPRELRRLGVCLVYKFFSNIKFVYISSCWSVLVRCSDTCCPGLRDRGRGMHAQVLETESW